MLLQLHKIFYAKFGTFLLDLTVIYEYLPNLTFHGGKNDFKTFMAAFAQIRKRS